MNVLLYDDTPAYLCHGGKQVHVERIYENLTALGVDVEYARWWDPSQQCDLIHMFGLSPEMVWMAHQAGVKVVLTHVVDVMTQRSSLTRLYRRFRNGAIRHLLPRGLFRLIPWHVLPDIDALVYVHQSDAETAINIYGAPRKKVHIIPHGCSATQIAHLQRGPRNARSHLISIASIVPRKNNVLLAKAARRADVPVVFLGKPFDDKDAYFQQFRQLVDDKRVIYRGFASEQEKNQWLTEASGFVLLSGAESGCIAVQEAAAAGLPMLLSNLPWAHSYGQNPAIQYVGLRDEGLIADRLQSFYATSRRLESLTFPVMTWEEIARRYMDVYRRVLGSEPSCAGD